MKFWPSPLLTGSTKQRIGSSGCCRRYSCDDGHGVVLRGVVDDDDLPLVMEVLERLLHRSRVCR